MKTQNLSKSEAISICSSNGMLLESNVNLASKNKAVDVYWANPNVQVLSNNWSLLLNDNINNVLHVFIIPANSIQQNQVKMRNSVQIDLQIYYNDKNYRDKRSNLEFKKWFVKTIAY